MTIRKSQDVAREAIAKGEVVYHDEPSEARPTDYDDPFTKNGGQVKEKPLRPMPSWIEYGNMEVDRKRYHVGEGFLEIGCFVMLIGPSYVGKSTFLTQLSNYLAAGRNWLFFRVERPLRILIVQAEDSENKLIKMGKMYQRAGLTLKEIELAKENVSVLTIRDLQDQSLIAEIERHAPVVKPDVICINPMTSYLGNSIYKDDIINKFLRVELSPMLERLETSAIVVHHPPKPSNGPKEVKDLTAFELQYGGAGMAALTNAPRGNIFLTHVDSDVFKLSVGKGFEDLGTTETVVYLHRSRDEKGVMLWEQCDHEQAEAATEKQEQRKATRKPGKNKTENTDAVLRLVPILDPVIQAKLFTDCQAKGMSDRTVRRHLDILIDDEKVFVWKIKRDGIKSAIGYAQRRQPDE